MFARHNGSWLIALLVAGWVAADCRAQEARAGGPVSSGAEFVPDPNSVVRYGPAYRYPQAGWIVLHIEGEPYDRGYQHGRLLAAEIADFVHTLAQDRSPDAMGETAQVIRIDTAVGLESNQDDRPPRAPQYRGELRQDTVRRKAHALGSCDGGSALWFHWGER